jgi:hypothetical protein
MVSNRPRPRYEGGDGISDRCVGAFARMEDGRKDARVEDLQEATS